MQAVLTDPQTSGGLLVACAPDIVDDVIRQFQRDGFGAAREIGMLREGPIGVDVVA
jgi:selenide,water dikinase